MLEPRGHRRGQDSRIQAGSSQYRSGSWGVGGAPNEGGSDGGLKVQSSRSVEEGTVSLTILPAYTLCVLVHISLSPTLLTELTPHSPASYLPQRRHCGHISTEPGLRKMEGHVLGPQQVLGQRETRFRMCSWRAFPGEGRPGLNDKLQVFAPFPDGEEQSEGKG